jgi:hypothetical protein
MKRSAIVATLLLLIAGSAYYAVGSYRAYRSEGNAARTAPTPSPIPAKFRVLKLGLTEQEVLAKLGAPMVRRTNPRFEAKSPEEWAKIQATLDLARDDPGTAPTKALLKAGAEMEHRTKDVWQYDAGNNSLVVVSFDAGGRLIRFEATRAGKTSKSS